MAGIGYNTKTMKQEAIGIDQLMATLPKDYTDEDREIVKRAYELAAQAHAEQNGHPASRILIIALQ